MARTDGEWWLDGQPMEHSVGNAVGPAPPTQVLPQRVAKLAGTVVGAVAGVVGIAVAPRGGSLTPSPPAVALAAAAALVVIALRWRVHRARRSVPALPAGRDVFPAR